MLFYERDRYPAYDFNRNGVGVVDMACFPGSSGSPIFIFNEIGYLEKQTKSFTLQPRVVFLGILFEGPQEYEIGELLDIDVKMEKKTVSVAKSMINLGYYIKSNALEEFREYITKILST